MALSRAAGLFALAALAPLIVDDVGLLNSLVLACAYAVMALGLNVIVGFAGLLDLGYVAFFAIGAYTAVYFASGYWANASVGGRPGIHLNLLLVMLMAACSRGAGRCADRRPDPAPARRLHRGRHARVRRDRRADRLQRPRHRALRRDAHRRPGGRRAGRPDRAAARRPPRTVGPAGVVLVRAHARGAGAADQPQPPPLADRPRVGRLA